MQTEMLDTVVSSNSQELSNASSALKLFENPQFRVRVIMRCAEPWFVAKDACDCLTLTDTNKACQNLDDDEKQVVTRDFDPELFSESKAQAITLVSESGLYTLIMRSNKPEAKVFRKWVTSEVLPSIRKTGSYSVAQTTLAIPKTLPEALRAYADEVERREAAEKRAITAEVERDEAIRTKAQIGSSREAKAMATASAKSRECKRLTTENELLTTENSRLRQDYVENKDFCKQLRAQSLVTYVEKTLRDKCSKALQELSDLMEITRLEWNEWNDKAGREVPRYAYHKDVCAELKQRILDNPKYLKRFK